MLEKLGALDIHAIDWHAERYDSAAAFQALIALAMPPCAGFLAERGVMRELVGAVAEACERDGADHGFIPCLAGEHRDVWNQLYAAYGK
jgi:hypothetical protein